MAEYVTGFQKLPKTNGRESRDDLFVYINILLLDQIREVLIRYRVMSTRSNLIAASQT